MGLPDLMLNMMHGLALVRLASPRALCPITFVLRPTMSSFLDPVASLSCA